jgi:hypothetical protein
MVLMTAPYLPVVAGQSKATFWSMRLGEPQSTLC